MLVNLVEKEVFWVISSTNSDTGINVVFEKSDMGINLRHGSNEMGRDLAWAWRESEGFDSDVEEGKGRIFAMPKEGAWTFSMKDGLVRVEN